MLGPVEEKADQAPPLPDVAVSRPGDLWLSGRTAYLAGIPPRPEAVSRLLGDRKPF